MLTSLIFELFLSFENMLKYSKYTVNYALNYKSISFLNKSPELLGYFLKNDGHHLNGYTPTMI